LSEHFPKYAKAGFFYKGEETFVYCFACQIRIALSPNNDPFQAKNHRNTCRLARRISDCENIPLEISVPRRKQQNSIQRKQSAGDLLNSTQSTSSPPVLSGQLSFNNFSQPSSSRSPPQRRVSHTQSFPFAKFPFASVTKPGFLDKLQSTNLFKESVRLATFNGNWSNATLPDVREMAKSGWFYLGDLDRVQCAFCAGVLRNWGANDLPMTEHSRHFPKCLFVRGQETRNIPDTHGEVKRTMSSQQLIPPRFSAQERDRLSSLFPCNNPASPHMRMEAKRLETFSFGWGRHVLKASPETLAKCGLFFLGNRDRVKCYYCNGGLQHWSYEDDPFEEHAKWYPTCQYILRTMGPDYVHSIVEKYPNIRRPTIRQSGGLDVEPSIISSPRISHRSSSPVPMEEPVVAQQMPTNNIASVPTPSSPRKLIKKGKTLLESALESDKAKAVIGMGFSEDIVKEVIRLKITKTKASFDSVSELLEAVLEYESTVQTQQIPSTNNVGCSSSAASVLPPATGPPPVAIVAAASVVPSSSASTGKVQIKEQEPMETSANENMSAEDVKQKLQNLKDEKLCKVCLDKDADVVFIPCGHICCCMECTEALRQCPICRKKIERAFKTYSA